MRIWWKRKRSIYNWRRLWVNKFIISFSEWGTTNRRFWFWEIWVKWMIYFVDERVDIIEFTVWWFNINSRNLKIANVSWWENGRVMGSILNFSRATVGFSFDILINLEKVKNRMKASIEIRMSSCRKYNFIFRGFESKGRLNGKWMSREALGLKY